MVRDQKFDFDRASTCFYLSMIPINEIPSPATVPVFYDAKPHTDGLYRVVYLDGHMKPQSQAPVVRPIVRKKHSPVKRHK